MHGKKKRKRLRGEKQQHHSSEWLAKCGIHTTHVGRTTKQLNIKENRKVAQLLLQDTSQQDTSIPQQPNG